MATEMNRDDVPTLVAVGVAVAICASLAHEALGHGIGCIVDGGTITLLTFLVFRCAGAGVLADGGGPVGAFVVACVCLIASHRLRPRPTIVSLFTYALGVQTTFWVCAQMASEGVDGSDDWGHVARDLNWTAVWHVAAVAVGVIGYVATIRIAAMLGAPLAQGRPTRLLIPYAATCLFAILFGAMWHGDRAASALDAFLSFGLAPLGYLFSIRVAATVTEPANLTIGRSRTWITAVSVIGCIFVLTIARGVGSLP